MSLEGAIAANGNTRGWNIIALRSLLSQSKADNRPDLPLLGVNLHSGVTQRSANDGRPAASEDLTAYKVVAPGNIIMNRLGKPHGSVGMSPWNGITSPAYWVMGINPQLGEPRFLHHLLRSRHLVAEYERLGKNQPPNQFDISWDAFRAIEVPLPPLEEQRRIADYLDTEIARIGRLTAARDAQLSLLEERELAVIRHMLSGGATSQGGRPTDWPWLPHIPADWSIGPVYAYYSTDLGKMLNAERASGEKLHPYLRNANVHWYEINTADMASMHFEADEVRRYSVAPGDLLVCEGGAGVAEAAVWDGRIEECYFQKSLHRVRQSSEVPVEWLMYWLRFAKACGVFDASGNLATIPHLTGEQLRQYRIPIPHDGQSMIRETGRKISDMAKARTLLNTAQKGLSERRQALITAAVTGQFDVSTASGRNVTDGVNA
ncbi:restriction endonuclease subunit S [Streptomyces spongiae]|uniref:Type I restriction modification DNA specificity domain-containing protein n=1 Tax=Streptomyces spongiae TaxID=565072 RepID=A0A5N8XCU3_9ACTN|nr:restriction endonuclease subunit S [Streptomyces spongiae]MPY57227.1 hypothetical protein [Streptomyces spongiae]